MATVYLSRSEADTGRLATEIAGRLEGGDVVFLRGPLGSGKTFFVRAAAAALGVTEAVSSPSFTMGQTYAGRLPVHHLDLYRLSSLTEEDLIDFEPFFAGDAITFIEWPELAAPYLENPAVVVDLEHVDPQSRRITVTCRDAVLARILKEQLERAGT